MHITNMVTGEEGEVDEDEGDEEGDGEEESTIEKLHIVNLD